MDRRARPTRPTTVAILVGDRGLAGRRSKAIADQPDLAPSDGPDGADIVVVAADRLAELGRLKGALVVLGDGEGLGPPPRAILPADADPGLVAAAVRLVAHGLFVLPESVVDAGPAGEPDEEDAPPTVAPIQLTPREREVLELLAAGASNKVIARRLEVSVHTAKFHVASLFRKLGASGRLEAVGIGLRAGLLMM
jgi:DNA-binding CsgD family transcriptional regulator